MHYRKVDEADLPPEKIAYSYNEAAEATGYSTSHLRRAVQEGYLVAVRPPGSTKPVIPVESLRAWIDAGDPA